jgi:predicted NBD/HSP70 family sugar kinase
MDHLIRNLPKEAISIMDSATIKISNVVGIGIGVIHGVNVNEIQRNIQNEIGIPVFLDNGANAAVMGEYYLGLGKGKQNVAFINCGVGLRTGFISSGTLIRSINNSDDALAHMIVEKEGNLCVCGSRGCLETYVSIHELPIIFGEKLKAQVDSAKSDDIKVTSYLDVCKLAESNNEPARQVILESAHYFGIGLSNFIRLLNPQLIILSGPYIQNSPLFFEESRRVALMNHDISLNVIEFSKGGYFEVNSIALGASVIAMRGIIEM